MLAAFVLLALCSAAHGGILPGQGFVPAGNLRSVDNDGPYDFSLLDVQANEIKDGIFAKQDYTDKDLVDFLVNVECLEGLFDTWGVFGRGFNGDLAKGGPKPIGAKMANLTEETRMFMAEVALNEQGHALFTRQAGGGNACPPVDFTGGWNKWLAAAFNLGGKTIKQVYGEDFDPFLNDANFVMCVTILEELGATGNKGLIGLISNPVLANGVAGLATAATAQAAIERMVMWKMRDAIVHPFGETVQQVFARASALRDSLDGASMHDQGLTNTDPRFIAVPYNWVNMIPTDVRGLTFNRSPQQVINILTLGSANGKGVFIPMGVSGRLNKPTGFDQSDDGIKDITKKTKLGGQESVAEVGEIPPPITGAEPNLVPGVDCLTQAVNGPRQDETYLTRGYQTMPSGHPNIDTSAFVYVAGQGKPLLTAMWDTVKSAVGMKNSAQAKVGEAVDSAAGAAGAAGSSAANAATGAASQAANAASGAASQAAGAATGAANQAVDAVTGAANQAVNAATGAASQAANAATCVVNAATGMASDAVQGAKGVAGAAGDQAAQTADAAKGGVWEGMKAAVGLGHAASAKAGEAVDDASAAVGATTAQAQKNAQAAKDAASAKAAQAAGSVRDTVNAASTQAGQAVDATKAAVGDAATQAANTAAGVGSKVGGMAADAVEGVRGSVNGASKQASQAAGTARGAVNDAATQTSKTAQGVTNSATGMASDAYDSAAGVVNSAGAQATQAYNSATGAVGDAATQAANAASGVTGTVTGMASDAYEGVRGAVGSAAEQAAQAAEAARAAASATVSEGVAAGARVVNGMKEAVGAAVGAAGGEEAVKGAKEGARAADKGTIGEKAKEWVKHAVKGEL